MPTVIGVVFGLRINAIIKSPQPERNANREAVMIAVRLIGRMMATKIVQWFAPSTMAASTNSWGMLSMKARITMIAKGTAAVQSAKITAQWVLSRCTLVNKA